MNKPTVSWFGPGRLALGARVGLVAALAALVLILPGRATAQPAPVAPPAAFPYGYHAVPVQAGFNPGPVAGQGGYGGPYRQAAQAAAPAAQPYYPPPGYPAPGYGSGPPAYPLPAPVQPYPAYNPGPPGPPSPPPPGPAYPPTAYPAPAAAPGYPSPVGYPPAPVYPAAPGYPSAPGYPATAYPQSYGQDPYAMPTMYQPPLDDAPAGHRGFYLRSLIGAGYTGVDGDDVGDISTGGASIATSLGFFVSENFALHGDLQLGELRSFGAGMTYYFTASEVYLSSALMLARGSSELGPAISVAGGKIWRLGDVLGIGVGSVFNVAQIKILGHDVTCASLGVGFIGTIH